MQFLSTILVLASFASVEARKMSLHEASEVPKEFLEASPSYCQTPVRKGKVSFPDSLAGRAKVSFDMFSGYINVTTSPDYLFYWFFGTQDGNPNAPLIIWTNGGPGCSSMEGATTENGPLNLFDIKEACSDTTCDYTGQFSANPYGWNKHANVLYVDQPRTVGYSFGYGPLVTTSVGAANDFVVFFNGWLEEFPEFVNRKVIISGESYGGHYIPAWSNAILNFNAANPTKKINLAGLAIGNGCVNNTVQDGSDVFVQFQHEQNLIPADSNPKNQVAAQSAMATYLGYTVNYYDYRIKSISCSGCYGYDYRAWSKFFLQAAVKTSLNVCGDAGNPAFAPAAGGCVSLGNFDANDKFDYSGAIARTLEAGIPVTLYYGKADTACNYVGGLAMANTVSWKGTNDFKNSAFENIVIAGAEIGQMKTFGGFTFVQVESAGHMVPLDQPAAASFAINTLLSQL